MFAKVDFKKAFDPVGLGRLHASMSECTQQKAEGFDVPGVVRTKGIQQGAGSSPTMFVTLAKRLLWRKWDSIADTSEWEIAFVPRHVRLVCWAGDNITVAAGPSQLRRMPHQVDAFLQGAEMSDWTDPEKCSRAGMNTGGTPIEVGGSVVPQADSVRILLAVHTQHSQALRRGPRREIAGQEIHKPAS